MIPRTNVIPRSAADSFAGGLIIVVVIGVHPPSNNVLNNVGLLKNRKYESRNDDEYDNVRESGK